MVASQRDDTLEVVPRTKELISVKEFLDLSDSERNEIKWAKIVPPKLGQKGFGKILIVRKNPLYVVRHRR